MSVSFYLGGFYVVVKMGYQPIESLVFSFVLGIAAGFFFVPRPDRKRAIPKRLREARWLRHISAG